MIRNLDEVKRAKTALFEHIKKTCYLEDIIKNEDNPNKKIESDIKKPKTGVVGEFLDTLNWYWLV